MAGAEPQVLVRVTPGRRGPHPRVRDDRPGGLQVRVQRGQRRGGRGGRAAAASCPASTSSASTPTSAARSSGSTRSTRRSRCWPGSSRRSACPELCVGGGLGVAYVDGEEAPTIMQWAATVREACQQRRHRRRTPASRPSRAGRSSPPPPSPSTGSGTIKDLPGIRTYVAVDGGMSDNPRPVLYGIGLRGVPAAGHRRRAARGP